MIVLAYYSGVNYLLELYFWLILGALALISLTIYFGRPKGSQYQKDIEMEILEGNIEDVESNHPQYNHDTKNKEIKEEQIEEEEEKDIEILIAEEKRNWALSFAVFGLIFVMVGGILLFISDSDFSVFLGSCMIYIGLLSVVKGISFQIPEEKYIINNSISIFVFFLNFFLLFSLLEIIGDEPMMEKSEGRRVGDFVLVYVLPYMLWRIVPSTNIEGFEAKADDSIPEAVIINEFDEEEGKAIRDFAEEDEDEYFSEEYNGNYEEGGDE
jgi:hypothetical protein